MLTEEHYKPRPLTKAEQYHAKRFAAGVWSLLRRCEITGIETWVKKENQPGGGYTLEVMERQDNEPILEYNAQLRSAQGSDWTKRKHGAIVSSVPISLHTQLKKDCGFDGFEYDRKKMKQKLNDSDFSKLRTVDGKF